MLMLNYIIKRITSLVLLISLSTCLIEARKTSDCQDFKFKKGYYYLLNKKGKVNKKVEPFSFSESFSEGFALVEKDLKFGYIDRQGNQMIDFKFNNAGSFSNGLAYASLGDKYGYINKKGEFVLPPQFEIATDFKGEYAQVLKSNSDTTKYGRNKYVYGLINKKGELIADKYFSSIYYDKEKGEIKATIKDSIYIIYGDEQKLIKNAKSLSVYYVVDEMPMFPGGASELRKIIAKNTRYPIAAQENGISGRVYVQFIIDEKGDIVDVYPICKESPIFMKEAQRVVKLLTYWKPGVQNGKAVKVSYVVPINFALR